MATIASLIVDVAANTVSLQRDVEQIHAKLDGVGAVASKVSGILAGAFSVGAITAFAKSAINFAGDMQDMAERTQIGVERLQALNYVGASAGVTVENIASAVAQMSKRLVDGQSGAVNALASMGLRLDDIINLSPDQIFMEIAEGIQRIPDPLKRSAAMMELFGRSGTTLLPLMTEDLRQLVEQAEKGVVSKEAIEQTAKLDDGLKQLWLTVEGVAISIGVGFWQGLRAVGDESYETQKATKALADALDDLDDAYEIARTKANSFHVNGLKPVALTTQEIARIEADLNNTVRKQTVDRMREAEKAYVYVGDAMAQAAVRSGDLTVALRDQAMQMWYAVAAGKALVAEGLIPIQQSAYEATGALSETDFGGDQMLYAYAQGKQLAQQFTDNTTKTLTWRGELDALAQSFAQLAQISGGALSGIARGIGMAVGALNTAMSSVDSLKGGFKALGGGDVLKGISGLASGIGGIVAIAETAISTVKALWKWAQGGEEGTVVNPARDQFIAQYGGDEAMGNKILDALMSQGMDYAAAEQRRIELMDRGLYAADTKANFDKAQQAIIDLIGGQAFHTGGIVPGTGEVPARLLGGEGVLSREGMRAFDEMNRGRTGGGQRDVVDAVNGLRSGLTRDLRRMVEDSALQLKSQMLKSNARLA